ERNIDYSILLDVANERMATSGLQRDYSLTLVSCTDGEILIGYLWSQARQASSPACSEREQLEDCYNLSLLFPTAAVSTPSRSTTLSWILGGILTLLCLFLLAAFWPQGKPILVGESAPLTEVHLSSQTSFNPGAQTLTLPGKLETLTYREAKLLTYFIDHPNEVLSRETIHDAVWGEEGLLVGRSLDVFVSRLRKKLKPDTQLSIMTVHGVGYKFKC
ncbi:MAG: winged helix-turn-helix domain-containing protein, partial [Bacteroidota bacterium]